MIGHTFRVPVHLDRTFPVHFDSDKPFIWVYFDSDKPFITVSMTYIYKDKISKEDIPGKRPLSAKQGEVPAAREMLSPLTIPVSVTAAAKEPRSFGLFVTSPIDIAAGDNAISLPSPGGTFLSTNSPGARMPFADSPSKALERDFCSQQFLCCGFVFKGLHDLLEHYDVSHPDRRPVAPVSAHSMLSSAFRSVGSDAQPYAPMTDICRRAIVDHLDPEMDISGAAASSDNDSTAPPQGAGLKRRPNKDLACKRKRKKGASSVNADFMSESNTDTDIDILTVDEEDFVRKVDGLSLLLPPTPPITPSLGFSSGPGTCALAF